MLTNEYNMRNIMPNLFTIIYVFSYVLNLSDHISVV